MLQPQRLRSYLTQAPRPILSGYCIAAAFGTYFCMYAFRKPFTAGTFDVMYWGFGFKSILITSQVTGYMLSKFIGIKVISEMAPQRRSIMILGLIGFAELALLGFAVVPRPWNLAMLFLNGLPLGMVFGLVLAYLEGRQTTEALSAGLCASFIVSSGVMKSVGHSLVHTWDVSEYWMPFLSGLLFVPPLLVTVWLLHQIPPPSQEDQALRSERLPMSSADRWSFLRKHGFGLGLMITVFVLLTIVRSARDDFSVEIWEALGDSSSSVFTKTETLIAFLVVILNGAAITISANRRALLASFALCAMGMGIVLAALFAHSRDGLSPFAFMVLVGLGLYIPYVAFHTTIFERLIASVRDVANVGFLMYLADALGYLGYVGLMLFKRMGTDDVDALKLFNSITLWSCVTCLVLLAWMYVHYARRLSR